MASRLLMVRHAERPEIKKGVVGNGVSITEDGVSQTQLFAKNVKEPVVSIKSSPVLRCIQTARIIADTLHINPAVIKTSKLLGDPGFFINDGDLAWQSWQEKGCDEVNQHLLTGTETWPGFHDFHSATSNMVDQIKKELMNNDPGTCIWITHDTMLATLASRVLPEPLTLADWPCFLGMLIVTCEHDGIFRYVYSPKSPHM